jgi:hypothetical protein
MRNPSQDDNDNDGLGNVGALETAFHSATASHPPPPPCVCFACARCVCFGFVFVVCLLHYLDVAVRQLPFREQRGPSG